MNLTVKNNIGEQFNIIVVRYFKFNGGNYLIFTKNEIDEAGYQKLYITKVNGMIGNNITDEVEWNLVRDTIKVIAKANKNNTILPVQDLNESEVNGIQIEGQKPFKLTTSSVALLSANKNVQPVLNTVAEPSAIETSQPAINPMYGAMPTPATNFTTPVAPTPVQPAIEPQVTAQPPLIDSIVPSVSPAAEPAMSPVFSMNQTSLNEIPVPSPVSNIVDVTTPVVETPTVNANSVTPGDVFDFSTPTPSPAPIETVDYKKLYEEQTLKLNALTVELDKYKAIVEQLKSILS